MGKGKIYIEGDGNGSITLSKSLAIIIAFITIISAIVGPSIAWANLNSKVDYLENEWEEAGPRHIDTIDKIENRLNGLEQSAVGTEVSISNMQKDITEIKNDIKMLIIMLTDKTT